VERVAYWTYSGLKYVSLAGGWCSNVVSESYEVSLVEDGNYRHTMILLYLF